MKGRQFWNVVPSPAKAIAFAILGLGVLIGLAFGFREGLDTGQLPIWIQPIAGVAFGLLFGSLVALWILCLGYVYADARRRAMPPILCTLLAALVPNLLGFLFYFALRKPIVSACPQCGHGMEAGQRFCASCGFGKLVTPAGTDQAGLRSNLV